MAACSNAGHQHDMAKRTGLLCAEIKQAFYLAPNNVGPIIAVDSNILTELIRNTKAWIEQIVKLTPLTYDNIIYSQNQLAMLLCTLDDLDADNLQNMQSRGFVGSNNIMMGKRKTRQKTTVQLPIRSRKRRRRLPSNLKSIDIVQAMHEAESIDEEEQGQTDVMPPSFYLSNSDRNQRAKQSYSRKQQSQHYSGVSIKAVMNAQVPTTVDALEGGVITTSFSPDAAELRRDLYQHLATYDIALIKLMINRTNNTINYSTIISDELRSTIKIMTSTVLHRITTTYPKSPSMRLSGMIALDSLRKFEQLWEWGYKCMLDELLELSTQLSLEFYAEILAECQFFENPNRLLNALVILMKRLLSHHNADNHTSIILRWGISTVLVCRQNILTALHSDTLKHSPQLMRKVDVYNRVCESISVRFGSASHWITPSMTAGVRGSILSALQAGGILSLFCGEDDYIGDDDDGRLQLSSLQSEEYSTFSSLRLAYDRMGFHGDLNLFLSHSESYDDIVQVLDEPLFDMPLSTNMEVEVIAGFSMSSATDDILVAIFSFLGYRSLARSSNCCKAWKRASDTTTLWATLYLRKYRNARFDEELEMEIDTCSDDAHAKKYRPFCSPVERMRFATFERDDYNWKHIFCTKYTTCRRDKRKSCNIIGCLHLSPRSDQTHMKRHISVARTRRKKYNDFAALNEKVQHGSKLVSDLRRSSQLLPSKSVPSERQKIGGPCDVLRALIFPFLDCTDLIQPICKLWTRLAECNLLWKSLYAHHFGMTSIELSRDAAALNDDWKMHFRSTHLAKLKIRGRTNKFGWSLRICPIIGCNKVLRSKFEYNLHRLKHEETNILDEVKQLKKFRKQQCRRSRLSKSK